MSRVPIFAEIIKIVTMFIKTLVERVRPITNLNQLNQL